VDLRELRFRISPWIAFLFGIGWILLAVAQRKWRTSWDDLYPGVAFIALGIALLVFIRRYMDPPRKPPRTEENAEDDESKGI
jgi:membrane protein implicated in regulation of membrane protease activity